MTRGLWWIPHTHQRPQFPRSDTQHHPMHPTQHSTCPPSAAAAVRQMTLNLRDMHHAALARGGDLAPLLSVAQSQSTTFPVKPAPMPTSTGRAA